MTEMNRTGVFPPGTPVRLGGRTYVLKAALPHGWSSAQAPDGAAVILRIDGPAFGYDSPFLPAPLYVAADGVVRPWVEGKTLEGPLRLHEAVSCVSAITQLVRFLETQGYMVEELDRNHLVTTPEGPRLRLPPKLSRTGVSGGDQGVFLLGALLCELVTGKPYADGSLRDPAVSAVPGLPQVLAGACAPPRQRIALSALADALTALQAPPLPVLQVAAASTVGLNPNRAVNEDSHGYLHQVLDTAAGQVQLLRACVADGMGGMAAGEVASRAAAEAFLGGSAPHPLDAADSQADWTLQLAWAANKAVLESLQGRNGGCTFTGALIRGARCTLAHVGDTRAYLGSAAGIQQLTRDHSLVAAMVANGMLTPEEAATSPDRNKVLRSLGSLRQPQPNYLDDLSAVTGARTLDLKPGEVLVIVSDGVWGEVRPERLGEILRANHADPHALVNGLIQATLEAGAPDNATALAIARI